MHPVRKQRLYLVLFIVLASSVGVGLVLYALQENMNLFYPPTKIVNGEAPLDKTIRAGGCVVPGSVVRDDKSLKVAFSVTDGASVLPVHYEGLLPDLFSEGEAAVLTGQVDHQGIFNATEVLAKHDETYMPPEVADAMQQKSPDYKEHTATCGEIKYDS
ncbi:Cytochrome c-type biogenesis protein CcmE [Thalassocella blandensis]|nr:Cytochrome c-type biogenesis protein CcmE [Thalassocella blandensis]